MLMADFVPSTGSGVETISKGTRAVSCSRDFYYTAASSGQTWPSVTNRNVIYSHGGWQINADNNVSTATWKLPFFGTGLTVYGEGSTSTGATCDFKNGTTQWDSGATRFGVVTGTTGTDVNWVQTTNNDANQKGGVYGEPLGLIDFTATRTSGRFLRTYGAGVITPIHTSFHYQTFETPLLHELVGGDRNIEQTNLVVSPDGKSWDEVTRDTSYIGKCVLNINADYGLVDYNVKVLWDECRGFFTDPGKKVHMYNKDFAISYDRVICLEDGHYRVFLSSTQQQAGSQQLVYANINDSPFLTLYNSDDSWIQQSISGDCHLKRGDFLWVQGGYWLQDNSWCYFSIDRI